MELLINIYIRLVLQLSWLLTLQLVNDHLLKERKSTPHNGIDNLQAPVHRQHVLQLQSFCLQAIKCHRTRHPPTPISKLCKEIKIWVHAALAKRYFCMSTKLSFTCVAGIFILAELPNLRISCIGMIAVWATEDNAPFIIAHGIPSSSWIERYFRTWFSNKNWLETPEQG